MVGSNSMRRASVGSCSEAPSLQQPVTRSSSEGLVSLFRRASSRASVQPDRANSSPNEQGFRVLFEQPQSSPKRRSSVCLGQAPSLSKSGVRQHSFQDCEMTFQEAKTMVMKRFPSPESSPRAGTTPPFPRRNGLANEEVGNTLYYCGEATENAKMQAVVMSVDDALREILQVSEDGKRIDTKDGTAEARATAEELLRRVNAIQIADANERKLVKALQDRVAKELSKHLVQEET